MKKSKGATGLVGDNCPKLVALLPEKVPVRKCSSDSKDGDCPPAEIIENPRVKHTFILYLEHTIQEPAISLLSPQDGSKIVNTYRGDLICSNIPKALHFERASIFSFLFWGMLAVVLLFCVNAFFLKTPEKIGANVLGYFVTVIFTISIQFLIFPRPPEITIVELTGIYGAIVVLVFSSISYYRSK